MLQIGNTHCYFFFLCYNKIPQTRQYINCIHLLSKVQCPRSPGTCYLDLMSGKGLFLSSKTEDNPSKLLLEVTNYTMQRQQSGVNTFHWPLLALPHQVWYFSILIKGNNCIQMITVAEIIKILKVSLKQDIMFST